MTNFRRENIKEYPIPKHFKALLAEGEHIEWIGKPARARGVLMAYMSGFLGVLAGIMFGVIIVERGLPPITMIIGYFFIFTLLPILNMFRLLQNEKRMYYAYTSRRIMISAGFGNKKVKSYFFDKITSLKIGHTYHSLGTIEIGTGNKNSLGIPTVVFLSSIDHYEEVYRVIKKYCQEIEVD